MIETALPLTALIGAATYLAFWLDWKIPALSKLGASLIALILGAVLSNTGHHPPCVRRGSSSPKAPPRRDDWI